MTEIIDDSALIHGRSRYDPVKAREYYLRTRQLKGRRRGTSTTPISRLSASVTGTPSKNTKAAARREELEAQRDRLEKRLARLKEVLRQLVDEAKARSGVEEDKSDDKSTPKDKADRGQRDKEDKPLTATQKKKKAAADRERYERENPNSPSTEVAALQTQIRDIRAKIEAALRESRSKASRPTPKTQGKSTMKTASVGR